MSAAPPNPTFLNSSYNFPTAYVRNTTAKLKRADYFGNAMTRSAMVITNSAIAIMIWPGYLVHQIFVIF